MPPDGEFDALVEGSSVGTPVAVARQAQTPPEVRARFERHVARLGVPVSDELVHRMADEAERGYGGVLRVRGGS